MFTYIHTAKVPDKVSSGIYRAVRVPRVCESVAYACDDWLKNKRPRLRVQRVCETVRHSNEPARASASGGDEVHRKSCGLKGLGRDQQAKHLAARLHLVALNREQNVNKPL
jgi:hypothetical protein